MGSFSITCGISGLPITDNDNIMFFPLFKDDYSAVDELHISPTLCDNDGSFTLFSLFSLPIYGKYNDQGGIYNIEEDENTNAIELYLKDYNFNSIKEFTETICDLYDRCDIRGYPITGMFVLREVYENIIKDVKTSYHNPLTREEQLVNYDILVNKYEEDPEKYIYETFIKGNGFSFGSRNADSIFSYGIYSSQISNPYFKERFVDLMLFNHMMFSTNSLYMPQMSGAQCGNYDVQQKLAKITLDIATRNLTDNN